MSTNYKVVATSDEKQIVVDGDQHARQTLVKELGLMIDHYIRMYIRTHGPKSSSNGQNVDMLRLQGGLVGMIDENLELIGRWNNNLEETVKRTFDSTVLDEAEKKEPSILSDTIYLLFSCVTLACLNNVYKHKDDELSQSCFSLIGFLIMVIGDINDGVVPDRVIDTLREFDICINHTPDDEISEETHPDVSLKDIHLQCERRQACLVGRDVGQFWQSEEEGHQGQH